MNKVFLILVLTILLSCNQEHFNNNIDGVGNTDKKTSKSTIEEIREGKEKKNSNGNKLIELRKIVPDYFRISEKEFREFKSGNSKWFYDPSTKSKLFLVPNTDYSITTAVLTNSNIIDEKLRVLIESEALNIDSFGNSIRMKKIRSQKGVELGLMLNDLKKIFGTPTAENDNGIEQSLKWKFEMIEDDAEGVIGGLKPFFLEGLLFEIEMEFINNKLSKLVYKYEVP